MVYSYAITKWKTASWNNTVDCTKLWYWTMRFVPNVSRFKTWNRSQRALRVSRRIFFWKTWEISKQRMFISRVVWIVLYKEATKEKACVFCNSNNTLHGDVPNIQIWATSNKFWNEMCYVLSVLRTGTLLTTVPWIIFAINAMVKY